MNPRLEALVQQYRRSFNGVPEIKNAQGSVPVPKLFQGGGGGGGAKESPEKAKERARLESDARSRKDQEDLEKTFRSYGGM